jgi:hypothetical protein
MARGKRISIRKKNNNKHNNVLVLNDDEVHFLLEAATDLLGFYRIGSIDKDIYPKFDQPDVITLVNVLNRYKDAVH